MKFIKAEIVEIKKIKDLIILKIPFDEEVLPCQFFMIGSNKSNVLLNRPFSVSDYENEILTFRIRETGKFTKFISTLKKGETLRAIGPCGNGLNIDTFNNFKEIILIGGGIGIAPLIYLKRVLNKKKIPSKLIVGLPSSNFLHYINDIRISDFVIFTEDGSYGMKGFPTDFLNSYKAEDSLIIACGPINMYKSLKSYNINAKILMEQRMACGFGACLGCVINTKDGYKRVCMEGPVFNLDEVIF